MNDAATCPECGYAVFMRAVRLVELDRRGWLMALLLGPIGERLIGFHAVCANCGTSVRVDAQGVRRLRSATQSEAAPARQSQESEKSKRAPDVNRTPTMQWSRDPR